MRRSITSLVLFALFSAGPTTAQTNATVCNGYSEYCSKLYSNVTVVGAHNSYTASNTNLAANQDYGVTQQLTDGIRLLQNQVHSQNGTLELCHTSCLLYDGGSLASYLTKVKTFLDANPNEVVTLLLVNIDDQPPASFGAVYESVGLDTMSWSPPSATIATDAFPTLGSLISSGKRLVTFMDTLADFSSVPYIIDEFSNMWESPFDVTSPAGFNCTINRSGGGDTTNQMYLINHYLLTISTLFGGSTPEPDKAALPVTNAASGDGSLGEDAEITCPALHARPPTFLLVDFYDWGGGSVFEVAATLNGVQYVAKAIAPQNGTDGTTGTPSSSTSNGGERTVEAAWTVLAVVACAVLGSFVAV